MTNDPLVEEIHQIRAKLLADCQGDLDKLLDHYKSSEDRDHHQVVTLEEVRARRQSAIDSRRPTG